MISIDDLVEVTIEEQDDFLKIRETLSRIGVASKKDRKLYQSCHILHKQGKYYIVHFKELFALDGKPSNFSEDDEGRRNTIANLMAEWGLLALVNPKKSQSPLTPISQIKVLSYNEKDDWELITKYSIGTKRR